MAKASKDKGQEKIITHEESTVVMTGFIHIIGSAKESYADARKDAIEQLMLYIGGSEYYSRVRTEIYYKEFVNYLTTEFNTEIEKGMTDLTEGKVISAENVTDIMRREYGI